MLGALAMIDDGELDWKILAISVDDPMASELFGPLRGVKGHPDDLMVTSPKKGGRGIV